VNAKHPAVLVACGDRDSVPSTGLAAVSLPDPADRAAFDALLAAHTPERLVVLGDDRDLAAVVLRLLRAERLDVEVGYVPAVRRSAAAANWGLPTGAGTALDLAVSGRAVPVPLVRDDAGGVLVGRGELLDVRGEAYCDDVLVLRGRARRLMVTPGPAGVRVTVATGRLRRSRRAAGRAVQIGCEPADVHHDGMVHPRAVRRWTWYRHTADLRLVRP
jgi:hypothetical protein